jgi:hypothetical protein
VFTESFLRRRGHCCENRCRHCPYGLSPKRSVNRSTEEERER